MALGVICVNCGEEMIELHTVIEDMKMFKKYYNGARLVDPLRKEVIHKELVVTDGLTGVYNRRKEVAIIAVKLGYRRVKKHDICRRRW